MAEEKTPPGSPGPPPGSPTANLGATTSYDLKALLAQARESPGTLEPVFTVLAGSQLGKNIIISTLPSIIGRDASCGICLTGTGISRQHARIEAGEEAGRIVVVDLQSTNGVVVNGTHVRRRMLEPGDHIRLGPVTTLRFNHEHSGVISVLQRRYEESIRDELTGIFNRRHYDAMLEQECVYAQRHDEALSVLLIDLDHFKEVNDQHGHQAGDRVLIDVARTLQASLRAEDIVARVGGEEFAVLLRGQDEPRAIETAERLRKAIESLAFKMDDEVVRITTSIGIAGLLHDSHQTDNQLMALADKHLYRAKRLGRNRCAGGS